MIDAIFLHACTNSFSTSSDRTECTTSKPAITETVLAVETDSLNPFDTDFHQTTYIHLSRL